MAFAATAHDKGALPVVDWVVVVQVLGSFSVAAVLAPVAVQWSVSALRALQVVFYFIVFHLPFALDPMKGPAYNYVHTALQSQRRMHLFVSYVRPSLHVERVQVRQGETANVPHAWHKRYRSVHPKHNGSGPEWGPSGRSCPPVAGESWSRRCSGHGCSRPGISGFARVISTCSLRQKAKSDVQHFQQGPFWDLKHWPLILCVLETHVGRCWKCWKQVVGAVQFSGVAFHLPNWRSYFRTRAGKQ